MLRIPEHLFDQAVRDYWTVLKKQRAKQKKKKKKKNPAGDTQSGTHMAGATSTITETLTSNGLQTGSVVAGGNDTVLPGFYRASKNWDILVLDHSHSPPGVLAAIELENISRSYSKNLNNRTEEALGNSIDLLRAAKAQALGGYRPPWLGYLLIVGRQSGERDPRTPVTRLYEANFPVMDDFAPPTDDTLFGREGHGSRTNASYIDRARVLSKRLVEERHYDAACLIYTEEDWVRTRDVAYEEPDPQLGGASFMESLLRHVAPIA